MTTLNSASTLDYVQALYRLLLIRTGQQTQAENAVRRTLRESPQKAGHQIEKVDFADYFRSALKMPAPSAEAGTTDLGGWPLALHQLPEPQRSAMTLFYLEIFSPSALAEILGVDIHELARMIEAGRKSLETQRTKSNTP